MRNQTTGPRGRKGVRSTKRRTEPREPFDKYALYSAATQDARGEMRLLARFYREAKGREALTFREDFCGTFQNSAAWVQRGPSHRAWGVDLDPEPLEYGRCHSVESLSRGERARVSILRRSVIGRPLPRVDLACALNFSYFIFKARADLRRYFLNVRKSLGSQGVFVLDCYGGSESQAPHEEKRDVGAFDYYWQLERFNILRQEGLFHIHFKRRGERKRSKVFSYDWRLWSIPEIRDLLVECGFKHSRVYWEGTSRDGSGSGIYRPSEKGDICVTWVAYIVAF